MKIAETKRLIIRQASTKDAAFIKKLLNSPNWIEFIGDRGIKDESGAIDYINNSLIKSYKINGYGLFLVELKETNKLIGMSGFVKRDYLNHPDIGFAMLPKYEGKGYSFEAAKAMMNLGVNVLKVSKIYAITTEDNIKSQNLLKKIGLKDSGKITPPNSEEEFMLFEN
ncbi:GNAT family N-acetyltransferase [Psychroserpens sp. SPM9]|uniref:GNAT family N-acetyltransferase n=1 Tax=Psychroserpens sp. SPM9 TaxID=2975598 RepID=UPI0021A38997|nr:GNAT family N-acetyltransferase [Psychroserpens sp. SPM9]MDG5492899.1 GNAT family N-acetyltransferase [Psychroserpens sp. SPM9]